MFVLYDLFTSGLEESPIVTGPTVLQAALQKKTARKRKSQSSTDAPDTPVPDTPTLDVSTANLNLSVNVEKKETEKSPSSAPRLTGTYFRYEDRSFSQSVCVGRDTCIVIMTSSSSTFKYNMI